MNVKLGANVLRDIPASLLSGQQDESDLEAGTVDRTLRDAWQRC